MNSASGRFQPRSRPLYPKICTTQYLSKILKDYRLKYSNKCNINLLRHSSSRRGWRDLASAAATHLLPAMPYGCSVTVDSACNATSFVQGKLTLQAGSFTCGLLTTYTFMIGARQKLALHPSLALYPWALQAGSIVLPFAFSPFLRGALHKIGRFETYLR